jgi:glyoxylase I family protein
MFTIHSLHHASLIVADTQRALQFYRDVLGIAIDDRRPELGFAGAWLKIGNAQQIHLLELPNPDPVGGRPEHGGRDRHLALQISDLEELKTSLEQAGVAYTLSRSGRRALFCRDPDGNALEFSEGF